MKKINILYLFTLHLLHVGFIPQLLAQEKMDLAGAIILNDSEDPTPAEGTIRFNPASHDFEGWNGLYWASLTGYQYDLGTVSDADGNIYKTVKIGDQEWMAENLRTTHYHNAQKTPIPFIANDAQGEADWTNATFGAYAIYDTSGTGYTSFSAERFGHLYNWHAVEDTRSLCPTDWHVPSDDEWTILINNLGGQSTAGGKMKTKGSDFWDPPNMGATNASGFTGLPSGVRSSTTGKFGGIGINGFWWTSTPHISGNVHYYNLWYGDTEVRKNSSHNTLGYSVRCIKD